MSDKTVAVTASTAVDFVDAAHAALGGNRLGFTDYDFPGPKWKAGKDKKLTEVAFGKLTTQITRAIWGGADGTPADKDNETVIKDIVKRIEAHEDEHASRYDACYKKLVKQFEKDLVGKDISEVAKAVDAINDALFQECLKLHKTEGKLEVKVSGGKPTVVEGPEGASGCKKK